MTSDDSLLGDTMSESYERLWQIVWGNATEDELSQYHDLLRKFSRRLSSDPNDVEDLIQEGYLGLFSAAASFNPDFGTKFITLAWFHASRRIKAKWDLKHRRGIAGDIDPEQVPNLFVGNKVGDGDRDSMELLSSKSHTSYSPTEMAEIVQSLPRNPKWIRQLAQLKIDGAEDDKIMEEMGIKGYRLLDRRVDRLERFVMEELIGPDCSQNLPTFDPPRWQGRYSRIEGGLWIEILSHIPESMADHRRAATGWWRFGMSVDEICEDMGLIEEDLIEILDECYDWFESVSIAKRIEADFCATPSLFAEFENEIA